MNDRQKAVFFYQLATLLNAGVPFNKSFALAGKGYAPEFRRYLQQLSTAFGSSQDLTTIPVSSQYFDTWTLSLLQVAQFSGRLPETCQRLARSLDRSHRWKRLYHQICWLALVAIASSIGLAITLLSKDNPKFAQPGVWFIILGLLAGLAIASIAFSQPLRLFWNRLPPVRPIQSVRAALFLGELAVPLKSGIPLITALELLSDRVPDRELASRLKNATRQIQKGKTLSQSLAGYLTPTAVQTIRTGEETGQLDEMLDTLATQSEAELEQTFMQLKGILFPVSILAVGGLVARITITAIANLVNLLPK